MPARPGTEFVSQHAERICKCVADWAATRPEIQAMAVIGSHACGRARQDSDIDLVLLTIDPQVFRTDLSWLDGIEWDAINTRPLRWQDEAYGALWSRRVWLEHDGGEIEFGFAPISWAELNPIDPGTRRVISEGCRILYDPEGILTRLCAAVRRGED